MEEEVKAGIDKFKAECEAELPGVTFVIPSRPTQGAYLVSFTFQGFRTYATIKEDDFADWGEGISTASDMRQEVLKITEKAKNLATSSFSQP
jgi:hypothetical protein